MADEVLNGGAKIEDRGSRIARSLSRSSILAPRSSILARNIVLAGFMGTGKSAVGKALALKLSRRFLDMDHEIQKRFEGLSIPQIFAQQGEGTFRAVEAQICSELSRPQGLVVATGGGAVTFPENRAALTQGGDLICLTAQTDTIITRLSADQDRPLLSGADRASRITDLLAQRAAHYNAIPWQVRTDDRRVDEIVDEILVTLNQA